MAGSAALSGKVDFPGSAARQPRPVAHHWLPKILVFLVQVALAPAFLATLLINQGSPSGCVNALATPWVIAALLTALGRFCMLLAEYIAKYALSRVNTSSSSRSSFDSCHTSCLLFTAVTTMESSEEREDRLAYEPPPGDACHGVQDYLIFLIGGNPGLISYYEPFLKILHTLLCASSTTETARFYVYGNSLAGFENQFLANGQESPDPLGLKDQIQNTENLIYNEIALYQKANSTVDADSKVDPKVILIGHSVGAYILLEMIRQHRQRIEESGEEDFDLIGGILLFPTIVNIAKSPSGLVASVISCLG